MSAAQIDLITVKKSTRSALKLLFFVADLEDALLPSRVL
jgi:hypothetical protein